jgi:hypothetical protein
MTATTNQSSGLTLNAGTALAPDRPREWTWLNWALALLAAPAAVLVMNFALGVATSTAACSTLACPGFGSNGLLFDVLYQGAAVVAGTMILLSFFTATRRLGFLVPLLGWGLLVADVAILSVTFTA